MYYWNKKTQGFYLPDQLFIEVEKDDKTIEKIIEKNVDLNDYVEVSEEEYFRLLNGQYNKHIESSPDTGYPILVDDVVSTTDLLRNELTEIQAWFIANDWKVNKIVTGEWTATDNRWINYLNEREIKRRKQDEIISLLEKEEQN